jgi:hypothetical protein
LALTAKRALKSLSALLRKSYHQSHDPLPAADTILL